MSDIKPVVVNISDSAQLKTEVAKHQQGNNHQVQQTNLNPAPQVEQVIHKRPYGQDGLQLSGGENYNPLSTILPNGAAERARRQLKDDDQRKKRPKKDKKKKKSFWDWLMGKDN